MDVYENEGLPNEIDGDVDEIDNDQLVDALPPNNIEMAPIAGNDPEDAPANEIPEPEVAAIDRTTMDAAEIAGVPATNDDIPIAVRRSGRTPDSRFRLHTIEEGYGLATAGDRNNPITNDTIKSRYTIAAKEIANCESETKVDAFLCAQTAYINAMETYSEVNTATQYAVEHLILTQVGMKKGINIWGEKGVDAILREMK